MKAATLSTRPGFSLMKQTDIQAFYHLQMPRWLFFDKMYMPLSLEAKVTYTFLLNRFQLSKLNNWINEEGEVFIIYTRESLAEEIQISYRRVIDCMKELAAMNLIWERRCGRGDANQIYLAQVELTNESASVYESAPFVAPEDEAAGSRPAETACLAGPDEARDTGDTVDATGSRPAETAHQDLQDPHVLCYAIAGTTFFSIEHSLDRLYMMGSKSMAVELTLDTGDGAIHTLTRSRVNDVTSITYDGVTIRQTDLSDMFGEKDVFLAIFNPLYFIEILGDKGKNLLERHLPAIPHEAVLSGLSDSTRLLLEGVQMLSPETFLERVRSDIRELDNTIIYVEGQRDLLEPQENERAEKLRERREEAAAIEASIAALEATRAEGINFAEMKRKHDDLYMRYDELSHDVLSAPDTAGVDAEIIAASTALEKRRDDVYVSKFTQQIAETGAAVKSLRERYTKETAVLNGLTPGIQCPMCKQDITDQNIEAVKKAFADSIAEVLAKGREFTAQLSELNALDEKTRSVFEQFQSDDIKKLEAQLEKLREKRTELASGTGDEAESRRQDMDKLKGQIQTLELDMEDGNLNFDQAQALAGFKKTRGGLLAEIAELSEKQPAGANDKAANIESLRKSIADKRELETAVKFYIAKRNSLMFCDFDALSHVSIVLMEPVKKTGEVKDVFKFSYDEKPYRYLSLSEKIKAGLEVSELMKRLTGRNYPVFIDNGESVPVIDNVRPSGQVFIAQVAKGAALKVDILGGAQAESQKAAA